MNKKFISSITAIAAITAMLPGMAFTTANADWGYDYDRAKWYYEDENGERVTSTWVDYNGTKYFIDANGDMAENEWAYDPTTGNNYYFDDYGFAAIDKWAYNSTIGSYCFFNKDGVPVITPEIFVNDNGAETTIGDKNIYQTKTIDGITFKVNIDLENWAQFTTPEQMVNTFDTFWSCYPKMYKRFASDENSNNVYVNIAFDNTYEGSAASSCRTIWVNDEFFYTAATDYDCIIHELGHTLQYRNHSGSWDFEWYDDNLETIDVVENFADYCRFAYSYKNGIYNDKHWILDTVKSADGDSTHNSIRFLIWLDYYYSTEDVDIIRNFADICRMREFKTAEWPQAWEKIFKGTKLEGKNIWEVWGMYRGSEFSRYNSKTTDPDQPSEFMQKYPDLRSKLGR